MKKGLIIGLLFLSFLTLAGCGLSKSNSNGSAYSTQGEESCEIKGNISSSGEKIYHVPGGRFYDQTKVDVLNGERWFCSEEEAVNAGWRKSQR